jgi:type I restriction enzyme, S subunit
MSEVVLKDIPESWEWTKLGEVITKIVGGGTPSKNTAKYWEGKIPWLTIKDMRTRRPADTIDHITQEAVDESSTNLIPADTVIMATRVGLGKVVRVSYGTTINQDLKALITPPELEKSYLEYWLVSKAQYLESIGSGTTVKGIRLEQVKDLDFPFAPPGQQKRIVVKIEKLFSHVDAGIAALNKAKQLLKQYRQSVLKAAITGELTKQWRENNKGKLEPASQLLERILQEHRQKWEAQQLEQFKAKGKVPKDDKWKGRYEEPSLENVGEVSALNGWLELPFSLVGQNLDGKRVPLSKKKRETFKGEYPYYGACDIIDYVPEYLFDGEHLLIGEDGANLLSKSKPLAFVVDDQFWVNNHAHVIKCFSLISSAYIAYHIDSMDISPWVSGSAQPKLNQTNLNKIPIKLPSASEQVAIVDKISRRFDSSQRLLDELDLQLLKAEKNKQSILTSAFSGGLVDVLDSDGSVQELLDKIRRQHVLNATKENLTKKRGPAKKKGEPMGKKKIIDVLIASGKALSPEKLFDLIGADGSSPDEVESFYIELKETLQDKNVLIETVLDKDVKKGDLILYKVEA